jgi:hypothetical protein
VTGNKNYCKYDGGNAQDKILTVEVIVERLPNELKEIEILEC